MHRPTFLKLSKQLEKMHKTPPIYVATKEIRNDVQFEMCRLPFFF